MARGKLICQWWSNNTRLLIMADTPSEWRAVRWRPQDLQGFGVPSPLRFGGVGSETPKKKILLELKKQTKRGEETSLRAPSSSHQQKTKEYHTRHKLL